MIELTGFNCTECVQPIKLQSNLLSISDDESNSLSNRLNLTRQLFEIASGVSQVQHPLCSSCSGEIIENLEQKLQHLQTELQEYQSLVIPEPPTAATEDLCKLENEKEDALKTLAELTLEKKDLEKEFLELRKELEEVEEEENSHWLEINEFESLCSNVASEVTSLNILYKSVESQLERLRKTNIYNDTFRITHDGPFGMINGQRLGRLPEYPVEWYEIITLNLGLKLMQL